MNTPFQSALYALPPAIRRPLEFVNPAIKVKTEEIRLRAGLPAALTVEGRIRYFSSSGQVTEKPTATSVVPSFEEIGQCFLLLCNNSVYSHTEEISEGYLILRSGHRAGICGTFLENGAVRDISSVNIRIAHEIIGCADALLPQLKAGGTLIAGPPGSGKTTLLRDLIRLYSSGKFGRYRRVAVIDSRGEIAAKQDGRGLDLGVNTDVMIIKNRALGAQMAVRTLFPDIIAFDEIGTDEELLSVSQSFNAGVEIITTAHAGSKEELIRRRVTKKLIASGAVSNVVMLAKYHAGCTEIIPARELANGITD